MHNRKACTLDIWESSSHNFVSCSALVPVSMIMVDYIQHYYYKDLIPILDQNRSESVCARHALA